MLVQKQCTSQSIKLCLLIKHWLYGAIKATGCVWSLSDAVTHLTFESTHYSSAGYNWKVKLRLVYINNKCAVFCPCDWLLCALGSAAWGACLFFLFPLIKHYLFCLLLCRLCTKAVDRHNVTQRRWRGDTDGGSMSVAPTLVYRQMQPQKNIYLLVCSL